ncbi:MAG: sodium:solute symporter family transporter [Acidimicrobiales bacterium]
MPPTTLLVTTLALAYTVALVFVARRAGRGGAAAGFLHGDRRFSARQVFVLISALWCSSIFVVEMETGYLYGVSAAWFGLATILMALATGYLLPALRRLGYLTSSGIIGERFGPAARVVSGIVVGVTFPIFAMSNVLAAAAFFHVVVGWALPVTLGVTAAIVTCYVAVGGMRGLAATQTVNLVVMAGGLALAVALAVHSMPPHRIASQVPERLLQPAGAGIGLIVTWVSAALLNVVNAQAELQILTAARDERAARRGLHASVWTIAAFTAGAVAVGLAARAAAPPHSLGVVAVPSLLAHTAPGAMVALVALAVWASALSWSAPLLLSGASSLGLDVLAVLAPRWRSLTDRLAPPGRSCVRVCLPLEAALLVAYGILRPADLAWWRVFGQTIRTGALIGPTLAVLALPMVGRRAAVASMLAGAGGGLAWNVVTGFSVSHFALGINPMWVGAAGGLVVIAASLLARAAHAPQLRGRALRALARDPAAVLSVVTATLLAGAMVAAHGGMVHAGLAGPALLGLAADVLALGLFAHKLGAGLNAGATAPVGGAEQ